MGRDKFLWWGKWLRHQCSQLLMGMGTGGYSPV